MGTFKSVFAAIVMAAFVFLAEAQTGTLTGKVSYLSKGEEKPVEFATLFIMGSDQGGVANLQGIYTITGITPGTYSVKVTSMGFKEKLIEDVTVNSDESTTLNISMESLIESLGPLTIDAKRIDNTATAVLADRKNSVNVTDAISEEDMNASGAGDAAGAMKTVTSVAVEDGKYMNIRGLGDRYSQTQLNNTALPSADPYRNSASMDLIPTDMVANIVALKTFTPDQPGNFTGGLVDITSKTYPDEFYLNFKMSTGFNTNASLNSNFLTDGSRGSMDWLGIDDGTRTQSDALQQYKNEIMTSSGSAALALKARTPANETERNIIDQTAKSFNNSYLAQNMTAPLNHGVEFSMGNKTKVLPKLLKNPLGYNIGVNYGRSFSYYENGVYGLYDLRDANSDQLIAQQSFKETKATESPTFGGIASLAYKFNQKNQVSFTQLYNHSASITNQMYDGSWIELGGDAFNTRASSFTERQINSTQFSGDHKLGKNEVELKWIVGRVVSTQVEPDLRYFAYTYAVEDLDTNYVLVKSLHDLPTNFYRDLTDHQYNGKVDLKIPLAKREKYEDYLKFGLSYSGKFREFNEERFEMNSSGQRESTKWLSFNEANGNFAQFLSTDNAGIVDANYDSEGNATRYWLGNYYSNVTQIGNSYTGHEIIAAGYGMVVYSLSPYVQFVGGARVETTSLYAESKDTAATPGSINKVDLLPSANFIIKSSASSNIRLSASQTLARPNMREISPFASVGGIGAPIVLGNPELVRTKVTNLDARYEIFPKPGQVVAFSAYFKYFENPIVWQLTPVASIAELKPINVDNAMVAGAEVEFRKNLEFISASLDNFSINSNFSYIYSRVDKGEEELKALEASNRPEIKDWRPFQGQSPYIANVALAYKNDSNTFNANLAFNIFGPRLAFVTDALTPDIYEKPRPSLNLVMSKKLGNYSIGFKVFNILNMTYLKEYEYKGNNFAYESFQLGRTFSLSASYKF